MTFVEYLLDRMIGGRGNRPGAIERLLTFSGWPDTLETIVELRDWLRAAGGIEQDVAIAEKAYRAYRQRLSQLGLPLPTRKPKPLCGLPRGSGAVVDAETLTTLATLGHEPRKVARQVTCERWEWFGDLGDVKEKRKYLIMLREHETLIQLSRFPPSANRFPVLFARIKRGEDPASAYKRASDEVEKSARLQPAWLTKEDPYARLGGFR